MEKLTRKELEVLNYLCKGCSNEEIAEYLYVSIHTIHAHVSSIIMKLKTKNRTSAAYIAGINGFTLY